MESCLKHPHELGVALCQRCGMAWCSECLVYAFGPKKPPYCMECAMFAGGVRSTATRPAISKRDLKLRMKAVKAAAKAGGNGSDDSVDEEVAAASMVAAPAPATDWENPWWEDQSSSHREPTFAD